MCFVVRSAIASLVDWASSSQLRQRFFGEHTWGRKGSCTPGRGRGSASKLVSHCPVLSSFVPAGDRCPASEGHGPIASSSGATYVRDHLVCVVSGSIESVRGSWRED